MLEGDSDMTQVMAEAGAATGTRAGGGVQLGALAGVVLGTLAVFGAFIIEGGDLSALILPSPIMIVVGGSLAALLLAYPASAVAGIPGLIGRAFAGGRSAEGAQVLRDAGSYAIITSLIAFVMGAIVILANFNPARPDQMGHALAVGFIAPLYGLVIALLCFALSRRLRGPVS